MGGVARFALGVLSAISLKLASSIDDVVWLSIFLIPNQPRLLRLKNIGTYLAVCLAQSVAAILLSTLGEQSLEHIRGDTNGDGVSNDKLLTLSAAAFLSLYAAKITREYALETCSADGDADDGGDGEDGASPRGDGADGVEMRRVAPTSPRGWLDTPSSAPAGRAVECREQARSVAIVRVQLFENGSEMLAQNLRTPHDTPLSNARFSLNRHGQYSAHGSRISVP